MEHKPNTAVVNYYAEKYATEICTEFFKNHEAINGKQILEITPTKQINLLIVKAIFEKWKAEINNIKSPYFNYQAPEVKETLNVLMNQLSKNILISSEFFKPLLRQAVVDTIQLLFHPSGYIETILDSFQNKRIHYETDLKPIFKYIKLHQKLIDKTLNAIAEEGKFLQRKRVSMIVEEIFRQNTHLLDKPYDIIRELNDVVPVGIYELVPDWDDESLKLDETRENFRNSTDYEQGLEILYEKYTKKETEEIKTQPTPVVEKIETPVPIQKEEPLSLLGKISRQNVDKTKTSLLDKLNQQKEKTIRNSFPLGLRIKFQNELFAGNQTDFQNALEELDKCSDYHAALDMLRQKYWKKYNWNDENKSLMEFLRIIDEHF